MQLFRVNNTLKILGFSLMLIIFAIVLSCEVTFNEPMQEYIKAVKDGKTLQVSVDDVVFTHDGDPVDFGYQKLGEVSAVSTVTIENIGQIDMIVNTIVLDLEGLGSTPYAIDTSGLTLPLDMAPSDTATFTVVFQPSVVGDHEAVLNSNIIIGSTDKLYGSFKLNLSGTGETGELTVLLGSTELSDSDYVYFDPTSVSSTDSQIITLRNDSHVDLVFSGISSPSSPFGVTATTQTIAAGQSIPITVSYSPMVEGGLGSPCIVTSDDVNEGSFTINLWGGTSVPFSIPGLKLWLDAQKIDSADTFEVITDTDDYVIKWKDQSGNNMDALAFKGANGTDTGSYNGEVKSGTENGTVHEQRIPQYIASSINGKPAVRFIDEDGTTEDNNTSDEAYYNGDILYITGQVSDYVQGMSVFVVLKPLDFFQDRMYMYGSNSPYLRIYSNYFWEYFRSMYYNTSGWIAPALNTPYLVTNVVDNEAVENIDRHRVWVNGENGNSTKIFYETDPAGIRLYNIDIGNYIHDFNRYGFSGDIAEILIYGKSLSDTQVDDVQAYLNSKYALW